MKALPRQLERQDPGDICARVIPAEPPGSPRCALQRSIVPARVADALCRLAVFSRSGDRAPMVFLHGFGSTKEDYTHVRFIPELDGRPILAFDAPGCGESECDALGRVSIPMYQFSAEAVI